VDRIIVMDEKFLRELKSEITEAVITALKSIRDSNINNQSLSEWVDGDEAKRILGYQKTKMQELRNAGEIVFSIYGRKIRYLRQSLYDFMEKNKKSKNDRYGI
jgi:hypothetical protein